MLRRSFQQAALSIGVLTIAASAFAISADDASAAKKRRKAAAPVVLENTMTGPAVLAVGSIRDQRIALYDANGGVMRARISSGRTGYETPVGIYTILQKNRDHRSNLYDAEMPFMQRLTWSGVALHAGALPGYPASHGCVRLPYGFADDIFSRTKIGMRVVLSKYNIEPVDIAHDSLPKPGAVDGAAIVSKTAYQDDYAAPANPFHPDVASFPERQAQLEQLKADAAQKLVAYNATSGPAEVAARQLAEKTKVHAKASKALRAAEARKRRAEDQVKTAQRLLTDARPSKIKQRQAAVAKAIDAFWAAEEKRAAAMSALMAAQTDMEQVAAVAKQTASVRDEKLALAKEAERRAFPVSIFFSRSAGKVYVRQGHEEVFEAPFSMAEPERPIGTYVFTALDFINGGADLKWNVVAINKGTADAYAYYDERPARRTDADGAPPVTDASAAAAALERIAMPAELRQRLAGYIWPGSSVIISDEGQSKETGKGTDHVVLISGEPQGAIKWRPRQDSYSSRNSYYYYDDGYGYSYSRPRRFRSSPPKSIFWW